MSMTTATMDHLIRSELWSRELKQILEDELMGMKYVRMLTEFPDGTQFTMPSVGQATVQDIVENQPVAYEGLDTGEFTFQITEYIGSAHYITRKALQDAFYAQQVLSSFVPKERRAMMERLETDILATPGPTSSQGGGQTASSTNTWNGIAHRWVASGTNEVIAVADFAKAKYALKKANVPQVSLVAIVDPSVAYTLETHSQFTSFADNPRWEGIVTTGVTSGMRFIRNIYGFDVYESNYLADANETIGGKTTAAGKQNLFFSAEQSVLPIIGAIRQQPQVDSEFNKDFQREEYMTTMRYGLKLFRPENMICVLSDTDQV